MELLELRNLGNVYHKIIFVYLPTSHNTTTKLSIL